MQLHKKKSVVYIQAHHCSHQFMQQCSGNIVHGFDSTFLQFCLHVQFGLQYLSLFLQRHSADSEHGPVASQEQNIATDLVDLICMKLTPCGSLGSSFVSDILGLFSKLDKIELLA